ncbi:MAG TPA: 3-deoxy-8-phosphooctulonate synthase [Deltaproteobacteria bacterium]|nr:3-deoxy-8-phosphooctulonate synthase [Deltaproteobacteria bacterium]HPR55750.1 3-deoxy-8-phosphooctulonate synthase [Deltaproteobacteria bacterium]HXK47534.1 3-deoxy-8-phosphooctulonate synthase [Deltaproteobacteria bacterium]
MITVQVRDVTFGNGTLVLIAGPCVIESRDHALFMAERIAAAAKRTGMPFIFKASFDKANRSSIDAYRGPGLEQGLAILAEVKDALGVPVLSDIHEPSQAQPAAAVLDMIQIPAFLCRQTDLLVAAGGTGVPVNIKKGQFMAPWDMANAAAKVQSTGNDSIVLTERGATLGYNNLVCDLRSLAFMRDLGRPVVLDVTHSLQLPGGRGSSSGGNAELIEPLARAGVAFGLDGIFLEVHDDPAHAKSDGPNSLRLDRMEPLLMQLRRIHEVSA